MNLIGALIEGIVLWLTGRHGWWVMFAFFAALAGLALLTR